MFELNLVVERYWQLQSARFHKSAPNTHICHVFQQLLMELIQNWISVIKNSIVGSDWPWLYLERYLKKLPKRVPFQAKDIFKGSGTILGPACILVGWVDPLPRVIYKCIVLCCLHFFFTKFTYSAMKTDMAFSCLAEHHFWIQKIVSPFLD